MAFKVTYDVVGSPSTKLETVSEGVHGTLGSIADALEDKSLPVIKEIIINPNFNMKDW